MNIYNLFKNILCNNNEEITFNDILLLPNIITKKSNQRKISILITQISKNLSIDIPILSSPMPDITEKTMAKTIALNGGLGIIHPFQRFESQLEQVFTVKQHNLKVGAAVIDVSKKGLKHIENLLEIGTDFIYLLNRQAHNTKIIDFVKEIKSKSKNISLGVGVVVTKEATRDLIKAGADCIVVGIGAGSHCTTRLVTGVGRPQLSAIKECFEIAKKSKVPIISEGGINTSADIMKAIVFGANAVLVGGLFTGTKETPGKIIRYKGKKYKYSAGVDTESAQKRSNNKKRNTPISIDRALKHNLKSIRTFYEKETFEEGVEQYIPYKGSVKKIVKNLVSGMIRSMWYLGSDDFNSLRKKTKYVKISTNSYKEGFPNI